MSLRLPFASTCRATLAVGLALLPGSVRSADKELRPPFGLTWNARGIDLEMALVGANGNIVTRKKEPGDGRFGSSRVCLNWRCNARNFTCAKTVSQAWNSNTARRTGLLRTTTA